MLCSLRFGTFFLFAGFVLLMTIFVTLCVPETKGVPIEELNEIIMQKVGKGRCIRPAAAGRVRLKGACVWKPAREKR